MAFAQNYCAKHTKKEGFLKTEKCYEKRRISGVLERKSGICIEQERKWKKFVLSIASKFTTRQYKLLTLPKRNVRIINRWSGQIRTGKQKYRERGKMK